MHPAATLVCFGIRHVVGVDLADVVTVADVVMQQYKDHSTALPKALAAANDKAWRALGVALAGNGLLDKIKLVVWAAGDEKAFREQVGRFLASNAIPFQGDPADFRAACLNELNQARKEAFLCAENLAPQEIAKQAAQDYRRFTDQHALIKDAEEAVKKIAMAMQPRYPNLAQLLGNPVAGGPPLLVSAFSYFFRREVEQNDELANSLMVDGLKRLSTAHAAAFKEVGDALDGIREQLDHAFDELGRDLERTRIAAEVAAKAAIDAKGAVLNVQSDLARLAKMQTENMAEIRRLAEETQARLDRAGMRSGEVRPQNSFSIRGDDERRAVSALLTRFRQLPPVQQGELPALLNAIGKLHVGVGDFDSAVQSFDLVATKAKGAAAKAEAFYNCYQAALEKRQWDEALKAILHATSLDACRFAPFPLEKYPPERILGAGGFGTVFLCRHAFLLNKHVVVKALHPADLARSVAEVFGEAHALSELSHFAIIGVQDCAYADSAGTRPYIVMPYFAGTSLGQFIQQRGTLSWQQLVPLARKIAEGMRAAHARNILHRDLKPDNILVRKEGDTWHVKIIDFGLAVKTAGTAGGGSSAKSIFGQCVAGTLKYAPPEQLGEVQGIKPGPYSDVFAFGKLCCFALFGTTTPLPSHWQALPTDVTQMLSGCLQEKLEHRYKTFDPVLRALEARGKGRAGQLPAALKTQCPKCRTVLSVAAGLAAGTHLRCPKCATAFSVHVNGGDPPDPLAQDMRAAQEEWRTKGTPRGFFEQRVATRYGDWLAAAEKGNVIAEWFIGRCLQEGARFLQDMRGALAWFERAANSGLAAAQNDLGCCHYSGDGVPEDWSQAVRWFSVAAKQGFGEAEANLADCFYFGHGVEKDLAQAAKLYRKAAEAGWARAQDALADCYFEGEGVEQDYPQAIGWYRKAAELGLANAQMNLGYCYESGKGVKKSWEEAAKWYRRAAEQGNAEGQFALGWCCEHGRGVEEDASQAKQWYRKAADQGHRKAKNALGRMQQDQADEAPVADVAPVVAAQDCQLSDEKDWQENHADALACARWYQQLLAKRCGDVPITFGRTMITLYVGGRVRVTVWPQRDRAVVSVAMLEDAFAEAVQSLEKSGVPFIPKGNTHLWFKVKPDDLKQHQGAHQWIAQRLEACRT